VFCIKYLFDITNMNNEYMLLLINIFFIISSTKSH